MVLYLGLASFQRHHQSYGNLLRCWELYIDADVLFLLGVCCHYTIFKSKCGSSMAKLRAATNKSTKHCSNLTKKEWEERLEEVIFGWRGDSKPLGARKMENFMWKPTRTPWVIFYECHDMCECRPLTSTRMKWDYIDLLSYLLTLNTIILVSNGIKLFLTSGFLYYNGG